MESKFCSKVLDFKGEEHLSESVSDYIGHGAINKSNLAIVNYPTNEVELNIDMLGECNYGLIIGEKHGGCIRLEQAKHLTDQ